MIPSNGEININGRKDSLKEVLDHPSHYYTFYRIIDYWRITHSRKLDLAVLVAILRLAIGI